MWITLYLQVEELGLIKSKHTSGSKKKYMHEVKEKPQLTTLVYHFVPIL
jgi:hypothetical protein